MYEIFYTVAFSFFLFFQVLKQKEKERQDELKSQKELEMKNRREKELSQIIQQTIKLVIVN